MKDKTFSDIMNDLPEVIYIMGTGRTGSTILEIILGNNPGVFSAGEMTFLLRDGYLRGKDCSCGLPFGECEVWGNVKREFNLSNSECQLLFEETWKLEWHKGFLPLTLGLQRVDHKGEYALYNLAMLKHIKKVTGDSIIVDSSKYTGRAFILSRLLGDKVRVLWLTRSPGGILASYKKQNKGEQPPKSTFSAFLYVSFVVLCSWLVFHKLPLDKRIRVRYEDLQNNPISEIGRIEKWCGYDLSTSKHILNNDGILETGHLVTGNRLRKERIVRFSRTSDSDHASNMRERLAVWSLSVLYRLLGI